MTEQTRRRGHSKSRFVSGWECYNKLWWEIHEPDAPELVITDALQDLFDQGNQVGALAREEFPGGVLIDLPYDAVPERVAATQAALDAGAPAVFEASFVLDGVFVAVDVLERNGDGFNLIEVKASSSVKDKHVPDAAIQLHVLRANGLDVTRTELMHLNREYRHPGPEPLLVRDDITPLVLDYIDQVPGEIESQLAMLTGGPPSLPVGEQCTRIDDCPFQGRCWPQDRDHVLRLNGKGVRKALELMAEGIERIQDLPDDMRLSAVNRRQKLAIEHDNLAVEPELGELLGSIEHPIGFLDFETVARAVPVWDGVGPWHGVPVQFSYHEEDGTGGYRHVAWLADGPEDPRKPLARALVDACRDAGHVLTYTSFERTQIRALTRAAPALADELDDLDNRLFDLQKLIKGTIYHPDFRGSFSIKDVLPVLVPELSYSDLAVQEGQDASALIAKLMLRGDALSFEARGTLRANLLAYCERDTWAMVKLLERLRIIAAAI
jgi:predicted RecB family nuclease